jgi:hypothetical protein
MLRKCSRLPPKLYLIPFRLESCKRKMTMGISVGYSSVYSISSCPLSSAKYRSQKKVDDEGVYGTRKGSEIAGDGGKCEFEDSERECEGSEESA